jgi:hypothetical protein
MATGIQATITLAPGGLPEEKPKLKVPDLKPMDFFSLFGER